MIFLDSGDVCADLQPHTPTVKRVQILIYYTSLVKSEHEVKRLVSDVGTDLYLTLRLKLLLNMKNHTSEKRADSHLLSIFYFIYTED